MRKNTLLAITLSILLIFTVFGEIEAQTAINGDITVVISPCGLGDLTNT